MGGGVHVKNMQASEPIANVFKLSMLVLEYLYHTRLVGSQQP